MSDGPMIARPAETIAVLRRKLAALDGGPAPGRAAEAGRFDFGLAALDAPLGGGLPRAALHEVAARQAADGAAAAGFVLGLVLRAVPRGRPVVWVRQRHGTGELGMVYPPGLVEMGADPAAFLMVSLRAPVTVLRAAAEALRCSALGAVVVELWGAPRALDLAATRRLALAAGRSGVTGLLLRIGTAPGASAALTRWAVGAAVSAPLAGDAPGHPAFDICLVRHRAGIPGRTWRVEWNRDAREFRVPAPLSRGVAALSGDRPAAPEATGSWRRSA